MTIFLLIKNCQNSNSPDLATYFRMTANVAKSRFDCTVFWRGNYKFFVILEQEHCYTGCIYGSIYALSCLKHKGSVQKRRFVHQENRSTSSSFPKMALEIFKQYLFLLCDYLAAAAGAGGSLQGRRNWGCYSTPNFFPV